MSDSDLMTRMRRAAARIERDLAPYAVRDAESKTRDHPQDQDWSRGEFQLDRDRILYASSFRRLAFKTQVFICNRNNMHRTRLTHSLEVAQLSRTMAQVLELNGDLCEAIALAHDLGHAPFGHAGETTLRELMRDEGGFEHNEHSLRVVEFVEKRFVGYRGLNLTLATREGIIKHQTNYDAPRLAERYRRRGTTLEAEVVSAADRISYDTHDLEDSFREGILDLDDLEARIPFWRELAAAARRRHPDLKAGEFFYRVKSGLIKALLQDVLRHTLTNLAAGGVTEFAAVIDPNRAAPLVGFSAPVAAALAEIEDYLMRNVYCSPLVVKMNDKAAWLLRQVFARFAANPRMVPAGFRAAYPKETTGKQLICDYLAGATDLFLMKEYRVLFDPEMDVQVQ